MTAAKSHDFSWREHVTALLNKACDEKVLRGGGGHARKILKEVRGKLPRQNTRLLSPA